MVTTNVITASRSSELPYQLPVDPRHDGMDSVELVYLGRVYSGVHPHTATRHIEAHVPIEMVVPEGFELERSHVRGDWESLCYISTNGTLAIQVTYGLSSLTIQVSGVEREEVRAFISSFDRFDQPEDKDPDGVVVKFWSSDREGGRPRLRTISVPRWSDVRRNYPPTTRTGLDSLMSLERPTRPGKLILFHGDPGTGKTSAISALCNQWRSWCEISYISDPDRFFSDVAYMGGVMGAPSLQLESDPKPGSLILCEDAGEYLRTDAGQRVRPDLSRLLNLTDGLICRGRSVLLLITTNEPLGAFHEAVKRPGRCLASIEFEPFDSQAAADWLGDNTKPAGRRTLAELYQMSQTDDQIKTPEKSFRTGTYL